MATEPPRPSARNSSYELVRLVRSIGPDAPKPRTDDYEVLENCVAALAAVACARHRNGEALRQSIGLLAIAIGKVAGRPHISHTGVKILRGMPGRHQYRI